jgi:hypothetical protein
MTGGGITNSTSISLFYSPAAGQSLGALCFLGFWQREMRLPEFIALINQRTHWKPTPRRQVAMQRLEIIGDDGAGRRISYQAAPPSHGHWQKGDIVFNTNPRAGKKVGWICLSGGKWQPFGAIDP